MYKTHIEFYRKASNFFRFEANYGTKTAAYKALANDGNRRLPVCCTFGEWRRCFEKVRLTFRIDIFYILVYTYSGIISN